MMKATFSFLVLSVAMALPVHAEVVRPAPEVRWVDASGRARGLAAFKGQPVVVVVAPSARSGALRSQLRRLQAEFERLAAQRAVFIAAFTRESGVVPSNIPFVVASDAAGLGAGLGAGEGFAIAVIGKDGNLDAVSRRVLPGQRVLDIINNSFVSQRNLRRL